VRALSCILRNMPRERFLGESSLVIRVFEAVSKVGSEAVEIVGSAMHGAIISGSYSRTPGQPDPRETDQRDQARVRVGEVEPGSPAERFYSSLMRAAEESLRWAEDRDARFLDGRDW
jgi:hypothetical protein